MKTTRRRIILAVVILIALGVTLQVFAFEPLPVVQDPLVRMPGTQPNQVNLEGPNRCLNCHAGYNTAVEPGFNWMGSMMAQSSRDFLFWSAMTVAAQDSISALGNPNATDLCERCHFPKGWLEGRSDPTNASLMTGNDYDGVQCDFCHRMYDPFFEDTYQDTLSGLLIWDETNASNTPSDVAADETYLADLAESAAITLFNGAAFYDASNQPPANYHEAASGQFFIAANSAKRASFADASARHQMFYSRFHASQAFCGTCHDVSNPALANLGADPTQPLPSEANSAFSYVHVERTYSEYLLSAYSQPGGAAGLGPFAPEIYTTSAPNNFITECQDCHMRDVVGAAADKNGAVVRPDGSTEHPESGLPLHDLTGGNAWVSYVLASAIAGSPNYDSVNDALLNQGPSVLTLDLNQGLGIDPVALLAGSERAKQQLQLAASIQNVTYNAGNGDLSFRVQNQTAHRLISGFPEGRRMFVNIRAYDNAGKLIFEVNPYDAAAGTLKGLWSHYNYNGQDDLPDPLDIGANEAYVDELVYEMHPSSTITGEYETFHFVLSDGRYKDNRIPPKGYDIDAAPERHSVPVWHGDIDPTYFTAEEYAGGYDDFTLTIPAGADTVEINIYYQTTSREYIEFLRDQINGDATTLPDGSYIIQTDPFFAQLRAWGNTIWQLWTHNMNVPGAAPFLMTQTTVGGTPTCTAVPPVLTSALPDHLQVTLEWSPVPAINGYRVYYDQSGKAQFVSEVTETTFIDAGLTNDQEYCYKVTTFNADCESAFSNILCAMPTNKELVVTAATAETGRYETIGQGKNKTTVFVITDTFAAGDGIVTRVTITDANGQPLANATVEVTIGGPENIVLTSGPSDLNGVAEVVWNTQAPNKRGTGGTTPGTYTATVTNVTAAGYTWDGVMIEVIFTIQ